MSFVTILDILMKAEERNTGTVSVSTYLKYFKAAGGLCLYKKEVLFECSSKKLL